MGINELTSYKCGFCKSLNCVSDMTSQGIHLLGHYHSASWKSYSFYKGAWNLFAYLSLCSKPVFGYHIFPRLTQKVGIFLVHIIRRNRFIPQAVCTLLLTLVSLAKLKLCLLLPRPVGQHQRGYSLRSFEYQ